MKKIMIMILAMVLLIMATPQNTYKMQGTVTNRNEIIDEAGHIWEYDTNGFRVGDDITITFHDRGTTNRTDDIIKNIK